MENRLEQAVKPQDTAKSAARAQVIEWEIKGEF